MGVYDREYYRHERTRYTFASTHSVVTILIVVNVIVFLLGAFLSDEMNSATRRLMVSGRSVGSLVNWYQFLSYGFAHADVRHIFFNMLSLWFFGRDVEARYGKREFLAFYLGAVLLGGVWWGVRHYLMGSMDIPALGASGACSAVTLLFIFHFPHRQVTLFFFPLPAWLLGVILVGLDLFGGHGRNVAYDIHLAGFAFAAVYFWTGFQLTNWLPRTDRWRTMFRRTKLKVHAPADEPDELNGHLEVEGDRILEKLNTHGEASLTAKERQTLEAYSRQTREKIRRRGRRD